jgi:hypothetical protein
LARAETTIELKESWSAARVSFSVHGLVHGKKTCREQAHNTSRPLNDTNIATGEDTGEMTMGWRWDMRASKEMNKLGVAFKG